MLAGREGGRKKANFIAECCKLHNEFQKQKKTKLSNEVCFQKEVQLLIQFLKKNSQNFLC